MINVVNYLEKLANTITCDLDTYSDNYKDVAVVIDQKWKNLRDNAKSGFSYDTPGKLLNLATLALICQTKFNGGNDTHFYNQIQKMIDIARAKNHDYAGKVDSLANFRDFGAYGIVVRIGDKVSRLNSFVQQEVCKVKDESISDTLLDLANYCLLCIIMHRVEIGEIQ